MSYREYFIEKFRTGYKPTQEDWRLLFTVMALDEDNDKVVAALPDEVIEGAINDKMVTPFLLDYFWKQKILGNNGSVDTQLNNIYKISNAIKVLKEWQLAIDGTSTDGVINRWQEVVDIFNGIPEATRLLDLLNEKANAIDVRTAVEQGATTLYWNSGIGTLAENKPATNLSQTLVMPANNTAYTKSFSYTPGVAGKWSHLAEYTPYIPVTGWVDNSDYQVTLKYYINTTLLRQRILPAVKGSYYNATQMIVAPMIDLVQNTDIDYTDTDTFKLDIVVIRTAGTAGAGLVYSSTTTNPMTLNRIGGYINATNVFQNNGGIVKTQAQINNDKIDKTSIINDLTTGGADKILSAEMGKWLMNNKLSNNEIHLGSSGNNINMDNLMPGMYIFDLSNSNAAGTHPFLTSQFPTQVTQRGLYYHLVVIPTLAGKLMWIYQGLNAPLFQMFILCADRVDKSWWRTI